MEDGVVAFGVEARMIDIDELVVRLLDLLLGGCLLYPQELIVVELGLFDRFS